MTLFMAGSYVGMQDKARAGAVAVRFRGPGADRAVASRQQDSRSAARATTRAHRLGRAERAAPARGVEALDRWRLASARGIQSTSSAGSWACRRLPRSLVCFDISTTQGTDTVGSCVWFENGRAKRGEYRKFKVKTVEGTDDFASMREVVHRYFERRIRDEKPLPDLIVIDGGKGQLSAAHAALVEVGLDRSTTDQPCQAGGRDLHVGTQ